MSRPKRIFIGLTEVAGYFAGLREGFEKLGLDVVQLSDEADPYGYWRPSDDSRLTDLSHRLNAAEIRATAFRKSIAWPARNSLRAARVPLRVMLLADALRSCDVFVFSGKSFVASHDLRLIRTAGKRIVWVFTGTDHRPPYLNGKVVRGLHGDPGRLGAAASAVRSYVHRIEASAHVIVAHGPSAQFHRKVFAEFLSVGIPTRSSFPHGAVAAVGPWPGPPGVRILHAPTDLAKGSASIRAIIDRLQARGLPISYVELTGRPHSEVRARLEQADLVVDEMFSDSPMGAFAAEAAVQGVPAVVGGYWSGRITSELPAEVIPPSMYVLPSEVEACIERLVRDQAKREDLGQRAGRYVARAWNPEIVAQRILGLAYGDANDVIITKPSDLSYCAGWGMSIDLVSATLRHLVQTRGPSSLAMSHNPALEAKLVALACESGSTMTARCK